MIGRAPQRGAYGPVGWVAAALVALLIGLALSRLFPVGSGDGSPEPPDWLVVPFVLLLASIAALPLISPGYWHRHYPHISLALAGLVAGYYLRAFASREPGSQGYGTHHLLHALGEYYSFIALVGGLYIVSGGILVDLRGRAGPLMNALVLAFGSVFANVVGTTGASMLLIRPYMRINRGRLRPLHIVFFVFIVSNAGGSLTPIGDPPLYLGYLRGVPFQWTLVHLTADWALVVGLLLGAFLVLDWRFGSGAHDNGPPRPLEPAAEALIESEIHDRPGLRIRGRAGIVFLGLMVAAVFIDPAVKRLLHYQGFPIGATVQVALAALAYATAPRDILLANDFRLGPLKEVALLFLGIFITMPPALAWLARHGGELGIASPTAFYFATGILSAILDNAPTYINFLQIALGSEMTPEAVRSFIETNRGFLLLEAISTASVFFGAMTYIGNGPNFMVKAIAEDAGVRMPSFLGYLGWACLILLPVLVLHWVAFIYLV
jgi:Na+/H+ antiporter NhaD/arsenite permease-like protein